jgi:3-oxoacyl-[acyl-carrier protein] reductase
MESNQPDDIAPFIVFLCTDAAANISGRTFNTAGGEISLYSEPIKERTIYKKGRWTVEELIAVVPGTLGKDLKVIGIEG